MNIEINSIITGLSIIGMMFAIFSNFKGAKRDIEKEAVEFDRLKTGLDELKKGLQEIKEEIKIKSTHDTEIKEDVILIKSEIKTLWKRVEKLEIGV